MELNADFSQRVLVKAAENDWVASPMRGVERKMLDRIGDEVARATTIVRFAPGAEFHAHTHDGGEEFLVLDGVFQDEHGDFPAGAYIRNPPTSHHTPKADHGTTILVKLHQFDPDDRTHVRVASDKMAAVAPAGRPGVTVAPLYADAREEVRMETWAPGTQVALDAAAGMEVFVIAGGFDESGDTLADWDWLRLPPGGKLDASAGPDGARVWIKTGHLAGMV